MRSLFFTVFGTFALWSIPFQVSAENVQSDPKQSLKVEDIKLPTEAEIEDIIDQLPDFNAIMGGMVKVMQDEDIQQSMKKASESLSDSIEKSNIKDLTKNLDEGELPDINKMLETLLRLSADEEVLGSMLDVVTDLQNAVEDNLNEDMIKPNAKD
jgi:hypothetical protein